MIPSSRTGSIAEPATAPIATNTHLLWDGRIWTLVNLGETTTTLLPEYGEPIQLSSSFVFWKRAPLSSPKGRQRSRCRSMPKSVW